jgi:pantetheine-phosphate adenylyltransferase
MAQSVIAVYPGTFDPMTLGHEDVVRRATQLFDRVIVAVAAGHHKKSMFTLQERIEMARVVVADYEQVSVESFSGLLRDFVVARGGKAMVRGLRAVTDFDYEFQLAGMNRSLMPDVETVFLTPSDKFQFISSTFVREIAVLGGEIDKFVSPTVQKRMMDKVRSLGGAGPESA